MFWEKSGAWVVGMPLRIIERLFNFVVWCTIYFTGSMEVRLTTNKQEVEGLGIEKQSSNWHKSSGHDFGVCKVYTIGRGVSNGRHARTG